MDVINAGKGGDDSGESLARMDEDLIDKRPGIGFVMLGGNDSRHWGRPEPAVTPEQYFENMTEIVTKLRDAGSRVVILSYPRSGEISGADLEVFLAIREQMKALRDSLGTGWIDIAGMLDSLGIPKEDLGMYDKEMVLELYSDLNASCTLIELTGEEFIPPEIEFVSFTEAFPQPDN